MDEQLRKYKRKRVPKEVQKRQRGIGIGAAKVEPVHIEVDKTAKPVQQKMRLIAIH